jgi:hypothetical protein
MNAQDARGAPLRPYVEHQQQQPTTAILVRPLCLNFVAVSEKASLRDIHRNVRADTELRQYTRQLQRST